MRIQNGSQIKHRISLLMIMQMVLKSALFLFTYENLAIIFYSEHVETKENTSNY